MGRIAVIGAGASGMMAAIAAAREKASVTVFEKNDRVGKKLLMTGNGKCNFTNATMDASHYRSGELVYSLKGERYEPASEGVTDDIPNPLKDKSHGLLNRGSSGDSLVEGVLERFSKEDLLGFFEELGVLSRIRNGCFYPFPETASAVLDVLRLELSRLKVRLMTECEVIEIKKNDGFKLKYKTFPDIVNKGAEGSKKGSKLLIEDLSPDSLKPRRKSDALVRTEHFDAVIVCTGGLAAPKTGSTGDGYRFAKSFGLPIVEPLPALSPLHSNESYFKGIKGIRAEAALKLFIIPEPKRDNNTDDYPDRRSQRIIKSSQRAYFPASAGYSPKESGGGNYCPSRFEEELAASSRGELQLTDYGLSGICTFDISSIAGRALNAGKSCIVEVNFLPEFSLSECEKELIKRAENHPEREAEVFLTGLFHKRLSLLFLKRSGIKPDRRVSTLTNEELKRLSTAITSFRVPVSGIGGFEKAQVTSGGVSLGEMDGNMMVKRCPGLFFCGEVLDVDGHCGGYNLQWAFSSGFIAGKTAAAIYRRL